MAEKTQSLYAYTNELVKNMKVNDLVVIDVPEKIKAFRGFLFDNGIKNQKKFITKIIDNKLNIKRVEYFTINTPQN